MKTFVILFTLFYFLNALAVAPYGIKGREQSATLYSNVHQFPNNQVTNLGGINALVETGNKNLLINPSFEHSTFSTGWFNLGTASWSSDVTAFDGKASVSFAPSGETIKLRQQSSINAAQLSGSQGLASIRVKSSVALKVCSFIDSLGATATNCVNVQANSQWGLYKVPFLMGATSSGISVESVGNVTGSIFIDDAFVGPVDLKADIDASKIAGESYFAAVIGCTWTRTSTTIGAFAAVTACSGPTVTTSTMGQWQTTDTDLPRQNIDNLPAGTYKATFMFMNNSSAGNPSFSITDGSTICEALPGMGSNISNALNTISCVFKYNSSGNRSFEILAGASSGAVNVSNSVTVPRNSVKFILEYFGSGSVYSSTNADTDWASCGHTTSSFTGFGTVSAIETQCKRQGGDLLMKGKFTSGTPTAVEARVSLPLWNGAQLVSAGSSNISSLQIAGNYGYGASATFHGGMILIEPSVSYFTLGSVDTFGGSAANSLAKANATNTASNGVPNSFNARIPIEGWQQSNIIIGQFNGLESCTNTLECTDTFSAKANSTGTVSDENVTSFINGNCSWASNIITCPFTTGVFTVAPNCTATSVLNANTATVMINSAPTSSQVQFIVRDSSNGAPIARDLNIICQKQGVDYVGKTAKAVAGDQSIATPNRLKVKSCTYAFGGASATMSSPTVCSTGTCVEMYDSCSTGNAPTFSGTGLYTGVSFSSGTWRAGSPITCKCEAFINSAASYDCRRYYQASNPLVADANGAISFNVFATISQPVAAGNTYNILECTGEAP